LLAGAFTFSALKKVKIAAFVLARSTIFSSY